MTHSCHLHSTITTAPPRDLLFLKFSFGLLITSLHSSYKYAQISPNIKKNITPHTVIPSLATVLYLFFYRHTS